METKTTLELITIFLCVTMAVMISHATMQNIVKRVDNKINFLVRQLTSKKCTPEQMADLIIILSTFYSTAVHSKSEEIELMNKTADKITKIFNANG